MTSRHPVRLVCVDLGGVVVRIRRTLAETLHAAGVPSYVLESIGEDAMRAFRESTARHQRGEHDCEAWLVAAHEALGGAVDRETILRAHDAVLVGEYPGVAQSLASIRAAGATTACLSNTNDRHWDALVELPAFTAIEHRHASHLLGLEKPGVEIYKAFERATGAAGSEILFLDDLEENCAAARACGWNAVRIDHERDTARQIVAAARAHGVAC
jgi:putative hydrolase of the HAD superfamily